jgi:hypothetical protein
MTYFDIDSLTKPQLLAITMAQLKHTAELCNDDHWQYSDDGFDYLQAGINLSSNLLHALDQSQTDAGQDLHDAKELLANLDDYACDGVCQYIYDLHFKCLEQD